MAGHVVSGYGLGLPGFGGGQEQYSRSKSTRSWGWGFGPHPCDDDDGLVTTIHGFSCFNRIIDAPSVHGTKGGIAGELKDPKTTGTSAESSSDGALSLIKDTPLEIVHHIFSHLQPLDLLHLSRTTRRLRDILFSRSARFVWAASLANVRGLPSCPPDMTEPQYVNLAFDEHCHFCLKAGVKDIYWACRIRCCPSCLTEHFVSYDELDSWIPEQVYIQNIGLVFPHIINNKYNANRPIKILYHLQAAKELLRELDDIVPSQDEDLLAAWIKSKKATQSLKLTHATLCEHWSAHWSVRTPPYSFSDTPFFDVAVTAALSAVLLYLWRGKLFV